ncbi:MAG: bifunctional serine/threonine-protein kinase/formylglycine-generating enzyme family protein [Planctomycetota bacterium]
MNRMKYMCDACGEFFTSEKAQCPKCQSKNVSGVQDMEGTLQEAVRGDEPLATLKGDTDDRTILEPVVGAPEMTMKDAAPEMTMKDGGADVGATMKDGAIQVTAGPGSADMRTLKDGEKEGSGSRHDLHFGRTMKEPCSGSDVGEARTMKDPPTQPTISGMSSQGLDISSSWANYEIIDEIARGGMGVVYKAKQKSLNRQVAIKLMLAGSDASEMDKKRFLREAEACAALKHPNIVDIFDIGNHEGRFYFAMEFVEGGTFDAYVKRADVELNDKLRKYAKALEGMEYAHSHKIIHRDLKPVNIMLTKQGEPKIMDFGLAKKLKESEGEENLSLKTATGAVMGTPHYMSPEQAAGHGDLIDTRTDIFALGVIMYEMVTGVRPFRGNTIQEIMYAIFNNEPQRPTDLVKGLDWELEAIILKALEKDIPTRYASVKDMREDILRFLDGEPIKARRVSRIYLTARWVKRNKALSAMGAVAALVVIAVATWFIWSGIQSRAKLAKDIALYEKEAQECIDTADVTLKKAAFKTAYPEVEKQIESAKVAVTKLGGVNANSPVIPATNASIDDLGRQIKAKISQATALQKCDAGDKTLTEAETALKSAVDDKAMRLEGKKTALMAMQSFNEAFAIDSGLARAKAGIFNAAMTIARAAREEKGYDLAILMYFQAKAAKNPAVEQDKADIAMVDQALKDTEDEQSNLKFFKDQITKAKTNITDRKWDEAEACLKLAKEKVGNDPEIPPLLSEIDYGRRLDDARARVRQGSFIESIDKLAALEKGADVDARKIIVGEMADARAAGIKAYLKQAQDAFNAREYDQAKARLADVTKLDAGNADAAGMATTIAEVTGVPENMIYIAGSEFRKGTSEAEAGNALGTLTLSSYYIGVYEVTNSEFYPFVLDGGYTKEQYWDADGRQKIDGFTCSDGAVKGPATWIEGKYPLGREDHPVTGISYFEARAFARWKAEKAGRDYRLCAEFEWEKAAAWDAAAAVQRVYAWGSEWDKAKGNFGDRTEKIGFVADDVSPYGCHDVSGNVAEWTIAGDKVTGVLRGGTFGLPESILKIFARAYNRNVPESMLYRSPFVGMRMAVSCAAEEEGKLAAK